jgi:hypothetical protein
MVCGTGIATRSIFSHNHELAGSEALDLVSVQHGLRPRDTMNAYEEAPTRP